MESITEPLDLGSALTHAPGSPILWEQFLALLARRLHCDSALMLVTDLLEREKTRLLYSYNLTMEDRRHYENRPNRLDKFNHFITKNPRQVYYNQAVGTTYREVANPEPISNENINYRFGLAIPCNHRYALSLLVNRNQAFNEQEQRRCLKTLRTLLPALEEALHVEKRHKIGSQIFHRLGSRFIPYIIVDQDLKILFADPVNSRLIVAMDCATIDGDQFSVRNPAIAQQLVHLIANSQGEVSIHNQCFNCRISLIPIDSLENLYHWECYKDGFILAFVHGKDSNPAIERLMEIYALSKCEAICALHFMQDPSIPNVAASTCRSQETIRNHLKRTMQKMGVHNQAALMKKLMALSSL